jgi:RNA polymerase sigma-70 factor, ECF subfamily
MSRSAVAPPSGRSRSSLTAAGERLIWFEGEVSDVATSEITQDDRDAELRALVEAGELDGAATRFMEQHGGDILAFLAVRFRDQSAASEVFSDFTEDFWRGLSGFRWRTSLRSWAYTLARNAANRYQRSTHRREARLVRPNQTPDCPQERRPSTAAFLKTEVKKRMRELRYRLPAEDQTLLVLRIDKGLSWNELAVVFSGEGDAMEEAEVLRWAGRLRQRFATIKRRLRSLAEKEGLIGP